MAAKMVSFTGLDDEGKKTNLGAIVWDGEQMLFDPPDSRLLAGILGEPVPSPDGRRLTAANGEAFLDGLLTTYRNAYLRATTDEEEEEEPLDVFDQTFVADGSRYEGPPLEFFLRDDLAENANPEGCNQYTGPGCGIGIDKGAKTKVKKSPSESASLPSKLEKETEPKEWDDKIDDSRVERRGRDSKNVAGWNFYDEERHLFPQTTSVVRADYATNPDDPDSEVVDVYRWESSQDGDGYVSDTGKWTTDRDQAISDAKDFAEKSDQPEPVRSGRRGPNRDEDDDDSDTDKLDPRLKKLYEDEDMSDLVGAPAGSTVTEEVDEDCIKIYVKHPKIKECERTIGVDEDGKLYIDNEYLFLKPEYKGSGVGGKMFAGEVKEAAAKGISYIKTHAAGNLETNLSGDTNGYMTWPLLGYDAPLKQGAVYKDAINKAREHKLEATTVQEIMAMTDIKLSEADAKFIRDNAAKMDQKLGHPVKDRKKITGRDWWLVHGGSIYEARFDLSEGSDSRSILDRRKS